MTPPPDTTGNAVAHRTETRRFCVLSFYDSPSDICSNLTDTNLIVFKEEKQYSSKKSLWCARNSPTMNGESPRFFRNGEGRSPIEGENRNLESREREQL